MRLRFFTALLITVTTLSISSAVVKTVNWLLGEADWVVILFPGQYRLQPDLPPIRLVCYNPPLQLPLYQHAPFSTLKHHCYRCRRQSNAANRYFPHMLLFVLLHFQALEYELKTIHELGFAEYFLIVKDIVEMNPSTINGSEVNIFIQVAIR